MRKDGFEHGSVHAENPARSPGKRLVIAFFESPLAATRAVHALRKQAAGKHGIVGVLALDREGGVDAARLGDRTADDGPGVGCVLGAIAVSLAGQPSIRRGAFLDERSDLSMDDVARYAADLEAGETAVAVLEGGRASEQAVVELTELGGRTEVRRLSEGGLRQSSRSSPIINPGGSNA